MRPLTQNLLRSNRRQKLKEERAAHEAQLKNPYAVEGRAQAIKSIQNIDKILTEQSPLPAEELSVKDKDFLYKTKVELANKIREALPSAEEQRRCPPGNVGRHMRVHKALDNDILKYKNVCIQLEPDSDDPDLANIELLRKEKGTTYSGFMADAEGPRGHIGYQGVPQSNWDAALGEPTADTALKQARRVHEEVKSSGRKPMSEEMKQAARERLAKAREVKNANRKKGTEATAHAGVGV